MTPGKYCKWYDDKAGEKLRATLAKNVERVKNWEIVEGSYEKLDEVYPDLKTDPHVTWFIDAPYKSTPEQEKTQKKGGGYEPLYGSKSIDFTT